MDLAYIPTIGHALALGFKSQVPERVGCLVESAHAVLAGLDPSDEMAFALAFDKLYSVHLNDQNGLKFDQDRTFGAVDLRRAFNQVRVLDDNNFFKYLKEIVNRLFDETLNLHWNYRYDKKCRGLLKPTILPGGYLFLGK